jgi:hypothetical protein
MAFYSGIIDFQKWAVINIPGQGSIGLNTFFGSQALHNFRLHKLHSLAFAVLHVQYCIQYYVQRFVRYYFVVVHSVLLVQSYCATIDCHICIGTAGR